MQLAKKIFSAMIDIDGHILGLKVGATENSRVCKDLLISPVGRGLNANDGLLAVMDSSKALRKTFKDVFGDRIFIQWCQVHKKRNVLDYLPLTAPHWVKR